MSSKDNNENNVLKDEDLSDKTVKGGVWIFSIRVIEEFIYLLKIIILANLLEPRDFGLFGVALLTLDILKNFTQTGFERALIQKKENIESYLNSAWTVIIIRGLGIFLILFFIAPVGAFYFNAPEATPLIQVIGVSMVITSLANIGFVYFDKELNFSKRFIYQVVGTLLDFILAVSFALIFRNVWAIIVGVLAGNAARSIMSYILHPYRPRLSSDFGKAKELWGYGKWIFAASIVGFLIIEADDIFVGILLGVTALGFYQMAYRISNLPATEITEIVGRVTFPAYSKIQDDKSKLKDGYLKVLKFVSFLTFLAGGFIFLFAYEFTKIFLGQKWVPMVLAMQALVIYGMIRSLGRTTFAVFQGIGKPRILLKINLIQFVIMAILIYPFSVNYNILGTSIVIVISSLIGNIISLIIIFRTIKAGKWEFSRLIIFPLISMSVMISSIYFAKIYWKIPIGIMQLGFLAICAFLIYISLIFIFEKIFNYKIIKELFAIYRQIIKR